MKNLVPIIFFLCMVGLFGCAAPSSPMNTVEPTQISAASTSLALPSATIAILDTATPEPLPPTTAVTPTQLPPTATIEPVNESALAPLKLVSQIPETAKIQGRIVLASPKKVHSYYLLDLQQIMIWDLESNIQHNLLSAKDRASDVSVTPDGKWLVYTKREPYTENGQEFLNPISLHIVSSDGQEQKVIPWQTGWFVNARWLDNEHLILRHNAVGEDIYSSTFTAKWLLNPFTGDIMELPQENPDDMYGLFPKPQWQGLGMVSYNPNLTFRAYLSWSSQLILENLQTHQTQDVLPVHYTESIPRWSPNGQELVVSAPPEGHKDPSSLHFDLYRVSLDGKVTRLTHLADQYKKYCMIHYYAWSPDGQKIAFWLSTTDQNTDRANLAVLDIESGDVILYDLESSYSADQLVVWSPDSQQLLTGIVQSDYSSAYTVLVELTEGWYARIADNTTPVGWMISEP